ncbi:hypothetical protein BK133_01155 [Paenibacillus sp. FSL H8-0548]|uniref:S-layer homology domain-containing protein n=1 Tax=Paenibacillus sp. FSL H8-0548 TaxID=1920422 RepID=UPI00096F5F02|nr:S-layer homology domain-containing protein [Paenibacillus sp. FSL H8-0548]OMF38837.1 hypothetical protein BK133_01155 [Paenibacillus sp. FSL H8-0548]
MMNKRIQTTALLLFLCVILLLPSTAAAAETPAAPVFAMDVEYSGKEATVAITGKGLKDVYAYHIYLNFDPKKLKLKQGTSGFSGFTVAPIINGSEIQMAHTKVGPVAGLDGDLMLATLTFERVTAGAAELKLNRIQLVDSALDMKTYEPSITHKLQLFSDLAGHWGESAIYKASALGFVNGYTDGTFLPNRSVTRAEFAVMLARALQLPPEKEFAFADAALIPDWAREYVAASAKKKWITGYEDQKFYANRLITREEMAAMIVRAGGFDTAAEAVTSFTDDKSISSWARTYVATAQQKSIIQGVGNGRFNPQGKATRAEAVTVILKLLEEK